MRVSSPLQRSDNAGNRYDVDTPCWHFYGVPLTSLWSSLLLVEISLCVCSDADAAAVTSLIGLSEARAQKHINPVTTAVSEAARVRAVRTGQPRSRPGAPRLTRFGQTAAQLAQSRWPTSSSTTCSTARWKQLRRRYAMMSIREDGTGMSALARRRIHPPLFVKTPEIARTRPRPRPFAKQLNLAPRVS